MEDSPRLSAISECLEPKASQYRWSILELQAVGETSGLPMDVLEIEARASRDERGFEVDWAFVKQLSTGLRDVWDLVLVGWKVGVPSPCADRQTWKECTYVIERVDSTEWRCWGPEDFSECLLRTYPSATVRPGKPWQIE
jgi:hypothetical protein